MFEVVFGKCLKIARFSPPLVSKNLDRSKVGEVRIIGRFHSNYPFLFQLNIFIARGRNWRSSMRVQFDTGNSKHVRYRSR